MTRHTQSIALPIWRVLLTATAAVFLLALCVDAAAQTVTFARDDYASYTGARSIASVDLNRDGWPDLAVTNSIRNSVMILLNQGDGHLAQAAEVPVGAGPFDLTTGDFNRDGIADLAVTNATGNSITVLLGKGDASFSRSDIPAPSENPRGIASGDVNNDGKPDLIYTGYATGTVQVLIGNGAGAFTKGVEYVSSALYPQGVTTADFNHDGYLDVAVSYVSGAGLRILYGNGGTAFTARAVKGDTYLNVLEAGDFDGDGWIDVAAISAARSTLTIYHGSAAGFVFAQRLVVGSSPRGIAVGDLNQDGILDLVTAGRTAGAVSVLLGYAGRPREFLPEIEFPAGAGSRDAVIADFDADGRLDIASANELAPSATVLSNATVFAPAAYAFRRTTISGTGAITPSGALLADFNRDGRLDVAVAEIGGPITVLLDGSSTVVLPVAGDLYDLLVADVNGDGNPDLVYATTANEQGTYLGDGHGGFVRGPTTAPTSLTSGCVTGDMNRDGTPDLVCAGAGPPGTYVMQVALGRGDGTFPITTVVQLPDIPNQVELADVNRDGRLDVVLLLDGFKRGAQPSDTHVWLGDGAGGLAATSWTTVFISGFGVNFTIADVNHDGYLDIVGSECHQMAVALGSATGFAAPVYTTVSTDDDGANSVTCLGNVSFGDLNVDGNLDVAFGSGNVMFGNGDGTFGSGGRFAYSDDPFGFGVSAIVDVNHDGLPDIVSGVNVLVNTRDHTNHQPTVNVGPDQTIPFAATQGEDCHFSVTPTASDLDAHALTYEWRKDGAVVSNDPTILLCGPPPGTYVYSLTVRDGRGGSATDSLTAQILGIKEIVLWAADASTEGNWTQVADPTAAGGLRAYDSNLGAAKVTTPLAEPVSSVRLSFYADPTRVYKLWIRLKADGNSWANDSVWVQFSGATDLAGTPRYQSGTNSALAVNLEECLGCGVSGWGWEDDGWGAVNKNGVLLRFPQNSDRDRQGILIQTREDGVSIDQIVLSAEKYLTQRPGTAKNDTTILPATQPPQ